MIGPAPLEVCKTGTCYTTWQTLQMDRLQACLDAAQLSVCLLVHLADWLTFFPLSAGGGV